MEWSWADRDGERLYQLSKGRGYGWGTELFVVGHPTRGGSDGGGRGAGVFSVGGDGDDGAFAVSFSNGGDRPVTVELRAQGVIGNDEGCSNIVQVTMT